MQARTVLLFFVFVGCHREGSYEITMHMTGKTTQDMTVKVKGDKLRFETKDSYGLYDAAANRMTVVMDSQKAYRDVDFSKPGTPQANTSAATATVERTGKHETVAGMDCTSLVAKDPSGARSEVCLAEGIASLDLDALKSGHGSALNADIREKKLFPLRSVELDPSGKELSRMEVTKIEKKSIDDSEFSVPKDYTNAAR